MSSDGSTDGIMPTDALKVIIGGEPAEEVEVIGLQQVIDRCMAIDLTGPPVVFDYNTAACLMAKALIVMGREHPELVAGPPTRYSGAAA
jgi:hypothetical protein